MTEASDETSITEVGPTVLASTTPHAYDEFVDYPPVGQSRLRWALVIAALLGSVAAVIAAAAFGVRHWGGPQDTAAPDPVVTQTQASRTLTLTQPDEDTAFLMELDKTGTMYDTAGAAVHNAKLTCKMLAAGKTKQEIADGLAKVQEIDETKADAFVLISIAHYCPKGTPD